MPGLRFALLLLSVSSLGHAESLLIDTSNSNAEFSLRALLIKRIEGDFTRVEGVIHRDPAARRFGVDVRIAADSVRMDREDNAAWAKSPDFFDSARHPWIGFVANDMPEVVLYQGGEVQGELTVRGITRPIRFTVAAAACARAGIECPVQARGELQRSEFGMDARRLLLSDKVRLEFSIRAHPAIDPGALPR